VASLEHSIGWAPVVLEGHWRGRGGWWTLPTLQLGVRDQSPATIRFRAFWSLQIASPVTIIWIYESDSTLHAWFATSSWIDCVNLVQVSTFHCVIKQFHEIKNKTDSIRQNKSTENFFFRIHQEFTTLTTHFDRYSNFKSPALSWPGWNCTESMSLFHHLAN